MKEKVTNLSMNIYVSIIYTYEIYKHITDVLGSYYIQKLHYVIMLFVYLYQVSLIIRRNAD